ncbi:MAG: magnesium/cobalt transporter CorA [Gammaproteobacteria bacterium]
MIQTAYLSGSNGQVEFGDLELLERWSRESESFIWIDFDAEEKIHEREILERFFRFDKLVLDDAQRDRHPPKLEWFDDYFFLLLKAFNAATESIDFQILHISFFVGRRFLVTRHPAISPSIRWVWSRVGNGQIDFARGPAHLCYRVVRRIIERYQPIILNIETRLEETEEQMLDSPDDRLLGELISYNSRLKKLRRIFGYQQTILGELAEVESPLIDKAGQHEYRDAFEHMERLASLSNLFQELVVDMINGYISLTSHRLNQIIKVLTIVTVVFLPLTLIAGIYGMNFEYMPELSSKLGYFAVLTVMGGIVGLLLYIFRKLRWL